MSTIIHFGTGGWYARRDGDFTEENVVRLADAAAQMWSRTDSGAIVYIGYDTREGAEQAARLAGMVVAGAGLVAMISDRYTPTSALSWAIANDPRACGGLMITGSNHSSDYLGIKVRMADGGTGTADVIDALEESIPLEATEARGPLIEKDIVSPYLESLFSNIDTQAIAEAGLQLVYDPMYGSARGYLPAVLGPLGVQTIEIHGADEPDAQTLRPEPIEPWVDDCERMVLSSKAHAGLICDGDGSRISAVDERGRYIDAHRVFTLVLGHLVKHHGAHGRVAMGLTGSIQTRRMARELGLPLVIKPIGFKYIYEEMVKGGVIIGGEETGGIGFPERFPGRDGLYAHVLLCEMMAKEHKTLGQLIDELDEHYGPVAYARRDIRLQNEEVEMLRTLMPGLNPQNIVGRAPVHVSHRDGLRMEFDDESWLLLRPSGTEPVVRIYAEAGTIELRDEMLEAGTAIVKGEYGGI